MAGEWAKLVENCHRNIRFVTNHYLNKLNEIVEGNLSYIEKSLELFTKQETSFQLNIDKMEISDDATFSTDVIDELKAKFEQIVLQVSSALRDAIATKTPKPERSEHDGSYHTTHSNSLSTQLKLSKKQISDIDTKLKELEKFNEEYDSSHPPSSTIMNFHVNKIIQVQSQSDSAFALIHSLLVSPEEIKTYETMQIGYNDRFELELCVLLDHQSKAIAAEKVHKLASDVKIESIKIQEFNGNIIDWPSFRDKYKALIHDVEKYSKVAKFTYLDSYIKDKHAPASLRAPPTEANYDSVWKDVCNHYDSDRILLRCLFDNLLKVKSMSDVTENEMKRVKNEIQTVYDTVKNIQNLTDPFDAIIAHIALFRMDSYSRDLFETSNKNEIPLWKDLAQFLDHRSRTLGICSSTQKIQSKSSTTNNTASSANTNKSNFNNKSTPKAHTAQADKSASAKCNLCGESHFSSRCSMFASTPITEIIKKVENSSLCMNCLGKHNISDCKSKGSCQVCSEKHFTRFHDVLKKSSNSSNAHHSTSSFNVSSSSCVMLATGNVLLLNAKGQWVKKRALFDGGATNGFMKESCAAELGIVQNKVNIQGTAVSNQKINIKSVATTQIKNFDGSFKCSLQFNVLTQVTSKLPSYFIPKSDFKIPDGYKLADPSFNCPLDCDILIGNDIYEDIRVQGKVKLDNGITLKNTVFGWIVTGPLNSPITSNVFSANFHQVQAYNVSDINESIQKFWKEEDYRQRDRFMTDEEAKVEEHFQTTYRRNENGEFEVTLPLTPKVDELADNYNAAVGQFLRLEKRLAKNPELKEGCKLFMREYIDSGDMSPVDISLDDPKLIKFYFTYHPILKEDSTTTKLRIVFNGSVKTASGLSFNDVQLNGATVQTDTQSILLKFRIPEFVATADIAKMFRKFKVTESQRPLQRIVYREEPSDPLQVYQLNTVTYGTKSASSTTTRCIKQLAMDFRDIHPQASEILENNTYVDDVIFGFNSLDEQICVTKDLLKITESANLDLRKFKSNKREALDFLPESKLEVSNGTNLHKALGVKWNTELDHIQFSYHNLPSVTINKRIALSEISKIYDPNGLLGPVTFKFKDFMRTLHQAEKCWDKVLHDEHQQTWTHLVESAKAANDIKIPRHAVIPNPVSISLHGFSDASKLGYVGCIYILSEDVDGNRKCNLLGSKSRLAGETQIPRLEVSGGVVLAHMITQIGNMLGIADRNCWVDSIIALCWINKQPANLKEFIRNRIDDIHRVTSGSKVIWRHIPTNLNSADLLSRGMTADEFKTDQHKARLWWNGPEFLTLPKEEWPSTLMEVDPTNPDYLCELRKFPLSHFFNDEDPRINNIFISHHSTSSDEESLLVNKWIFDEKVFSSTEKVRARVALMCRFIFNCRAKAVNKARRTTAMTENHPVSLIDYKEADKLIARLIQMRNFPREFNALRNQQSIHDKSKLIHHDAKWEESEKLIRLGNRCKDSKVCKEMRHPLPLAKCHYTMLMLDELHKRNMHAGIRTTASTFNMRYWIPDIHSLTRSVIYRCVKCFRCKPKLDQQYTGDLPECRLDFPSAFHHTGVDYAGPFMLRSSTLRKAPQTKAWIAVFVCMGCGAVHIEVVSSLTKESFFRAFHNFVSRRGLCFSLISDNAGCFVGTANEQKEFKKFLADHETEFQQFFNIRHVEYKTIPPRSPNFGGMWEEKVKQIKRHLYPSIGDTILTFEELYSICCRIEAVMNSRPLSYIDTDPNDPQPLTPGHFLIGRSLMSLPEESEGDDKISDMKRYRRTTQIFQHFHKRWLKEVLPQLQKRTKNFIRTTDYKVGQVVLMCEENVPPQNWPLAIITKIIPGKDNRVRVVTLRTSQGKEFNRAVSKIATLPIADNIDAHHFSGGE